MGSLALLCFDFLPRIRTEPAVQVEEVLMAEVM